jgi:putative tryptophan/tyrosine transport system substrate-binding protein
MRRREFIVALGAAAISQSLKAYADQPTMPIVGFLNSASAKDYGRLVSSFLQGLQEAGFVEARDVAIEFRRAEGHYDLLPTLAADLIQHRVAVIAATGSANAAQAAIAATATIPIVFANGSDPIKVGLVDSLSHPGRNATGVSFLHGQVVPKRLELLHQVVPDRAIGFLMNPKNPVTNEDLTDVRNAARKIKVDIRVLPAASESEIDAAFASFVRQQVGAVLINVDAFYFSRRNQLTALAAQYKLPAMYYERSYVVAGGLMSYGSNNANFYHQAGRYVGLILKGAKPGDLPVVLPTQFELVVNARTARELALDLPASLLALADEVIE